MNTGRWSLLSITDIHYESPNTNFLDDPKELQWAGVRDNVFPQFNRILENAFSRESFDLIAVGGDITTHGKKTGFTTFTNDALPSLRKLVRRDQAVCIVPGNHDVTWNLDPTRRGAFQTKFREFRALADRSHATSCLFPDGELIEKLDDNLTLIRPQYGPIYRDDDRKLLVLCINSAIRCGELNKQMKKEIDTPAGRALKEVKKKPRGSATTDLTNLTQAMQKYLIRDVAHVTQAQRGKLADILQSQQQELGEDWASFLRVAIVHHHLIHFPGQLTEHKSYELLIDSADVLGLLADFDFDLVLTGHKHQPYAVPHLTGSKELLLIGGPTVGGYAPDNSFRGIRQIDISDHGDHRSFKITNIPNTVGQGSVAAGMEQCVREADSKDVPRPPSLAWGRRSKLAGFYYREMASITLIGRDGDARRIVECEDFAALTAAHERAARHPISLPSTSGYLDSLRAQGMGFTVSVDRPIQRDEPRRKDFKSVLRFNEPAGYPQPASYSYQWHAVNAFALDTRQFNYKYGRDPERLDDIEFTHFTTDDPVEDLTVVVRFPPGYRLKTPPRVRIAEVNSDVPDARKWNIDVEMQDRLKSTHALRYYESLSIAALRVKYPRRGLSYGIQWDVPDAVNAASSSPEAEDLVMRIQAAPLDRARRARLVETLARIFIAARQGILKNWTGPLDGGLMYFDGVRTLPLLAAAQEQRGSLGKFARKELLYTTTLNYGDGIAGRAFKANRPRVYVLPGNMESDGPDYYVHLEGSPAHKVLLCLPVHVPVETAVFDANPRIYETKAPYGVVSLGSTFGDCPLSQFQRQETTPKLLRVHAILLR